MVTICKLQLFFVAVENNDLRKERDGILLQQQDSLRLQLVQSTSIVANEVLSI